jgi:hypothetical protein
MEISLFLTGNKSGLAALLRRDRPHLVAIHCLDHRLELSFKDVVAKSKLYDRLPSIHIAELGSNWPSGFREN